MTDNHSGHRRRILVCTPDSLGARMAGPAIRAVEISRELAKHCEVRLISTNRSNLVLENIDVDYANGEDLRPHVAWADVIVLQGSVLAAHDWITDEDVAVAVDIYDPIHLEILEQARYFSDDERFRLSQGTRDMINQQILRADFLLCASEKQRDFWLGHLASLGRVSPVNYDYDTSLRSLLAVVPFGISAEPPVQTRSGIKGVVNGIAQEDKLVIWGGGIYNWFDPLTLIRAIHRLSATRPNLRMYFLGGKHPNPDVPEMEMVGKAVALARELGILDTFVFFNEGWVPYEDRANFLLDADLGVSTHFDHLETTFSFRTRILDYLWAGLPIVATQGDTFESIITHNDIGRVVPPEDIDALVDAIDYCLYDATSPQRLRKNVATFAKVMHWNLLLRPLVDFCKNPHRAADVSLLATPRAHNMIHEYDAVRAEADRLAYRIHKMETSTSWRVTRPIRAVKSLMLRLAAASRRRGSRR